MIHGVVNARHEAIVRLRLRGPGGTELDIDAVVDSGFTASLTVPPLVVASLGLAQHSGSRAMLADGSMRSFGVYAAEVFWDATWRPILVWAIGGESLIGMRLLAGHRLSVEVVPGGLVEISPLPCRNRRIAQGESLITARTANPPSPDRPSSRRPAGTVPDRKP